MSVRRAASNDLARLVDIYSDSFDVPWSHRTMSEFVDADSILVTGDPVSGFIIAATVLDEAEIITLAIAPAARQKGAATTLINYLMSDLAKAGVTRLTLEVAKDNVAARSLYKCLGFSQIGLRKGYYKRGDGVSEDALVLARALNDVQIVANS
jgi:[ribosomal protein S18]-alanine N-acetyltransferase